jgi:hypothetical protein
LDYWSIGNGVAEGDSKLDNVRTTGFQRHHQGHRRIGSWESSRQERHKDTALSSVHHPEHILCDARFILWSGVSGSFWTEH